MIRSTLILLGTFALLVAPGAAQDKPRTKADKPSVYVVDVTGMQWRVNCVNRVRETLTDLAGVNTVKIDFDKKQATVTMKKGQLTKKGVTKALGGAGFGVNGFSGGRPEAWLIHVTGMQWGVSCVAKVRATLTGMKGVEKVGVDFKKSTATVWMKKGHHLQRKSVEVALKKSGGFGVKNVEAYAQPKKKAKKKAKKG